MPLVHGVSLEGGENEVVDKRLLGVGDHRLNRTQFQRFLPYGGEVRLVTDIDAEGDNVQVVFFLQPLDGYRCIHAAAISEHYFISHTSPP